LGGLPSPVRYRNFFCFASSFWSSLSSLFLFFPASLLSPSSQFLCGVTACLVRDVSLGRRHLGGSSAVPSFFFPPPPHPLHLQDFFCRGGLCLPPGTPSFFSFLSNAIGHVPCVVHFLILVPPCRLPGLPCFVFFLFFWACPLASAWLLCPAAAAFPVPFRDLRLRRVRPFEEKTFFVPPNLFPSFLVFFLSTGAVPA